MARKPKVEAAPEDLLAVGHHWGLRGFGYDVLEDGKVKLPPGLVDELSALMDRENGINKLLRQVQELAAEQLAAVSRDQRRWWDRTFANIGVERGSGEPWSYTDGCIQRMPKPEPEPETKPADA